MIFSRKSAAAKARYEVEPDLDERPEIPVPDFGPYDIEVAPDDDLPRIDLGALQVPNLKGVALQLEAAPNGQIVRVQLEHQGSRLQLGAFAAPRTEGIWDDLRPELRQALLGNGAKVVEVEGPYGPQLAARMNGGAQGGATVEVRHVGIDGPRWFVHAVLIGPAAVDPDHSGPLHDVLRGLVVDRGAEARPVREALPLRLPPELAEAAQAQAAQVEARPPQAQPAEPAPASPAGPATEPAAPTAPARPIASRPGKATARPASGAPAATPTGPEPGAAPPRKSPGRTQSSRRRGR